MSKPVPVIEVLSRTSVKLRGGFTVTEIMDHSDYVGHAFKTGWLAGSIYVSHDEGDTWEPSNIGFGGNS